MNSVVSIDYKNIVIVGLFYKLLHKHLVLVLRRPQYRHFIIFQPHIFQERNRVHLLAIDLCLALELLDFQLKLLSLEPIVAEVYGRLAAVASDRSISISLLF